MTDESGKKMTGQASPMPPFAEFVLTRRIPCACLALLMFTATIWGLFFSAVPLLAALLMLAGIGLNLLTPALFALIVFGGGLVYAMQVALIAAAVVTVATGFDLMSGAVFLLLYALMPALAAQSLRRIGGLSRSARLLAIGLFLATMVALTAGAMAQGLELRSFVEQIVAPSFNMLTALVPDALHAAVEQTRQLFVLALPGLLAFSLWLTWWLDVLLGRKVAAKYGFFTGDHSEILMLRFDKGTGVALIAAMVLATITGGSLQYVAISTAIMLAGMLAMQGVAVVHLWLRVRDMQMTLVIMYLLLLIWSAMIIPFIIAGLLDIWFDFRRYIVPANGEE